MIKESLKKGLEIVKESIPLLLILSIINVFANLLSLYALQTTEVTEQGVPQYSLFFKITAVFGVLIYLFMHAGTLGYVRNKLKLENASLSTFLSSGFKYTFPLFGSYLAFFLSLIAIEIGVVLTFVSITSITGHHPELSQTGGIVLAVGGAILIFSFLALLFFYVPTIIAADDSKVFAAIKKSTHFMKKHVGITFGLIGITTLFYLFSSGFSFTNTDPTVNTTTFQIVLLPLLAIFAAFMEIYLTSVTMNVYLRLSKQETDLKET